MVLQIFLVIVFMASSLGALAVQYWVLKLAVRNGLRAALADAYLRSTPSALSSAAPASIKPVPSKDSYGLLAGLEAAERSDQT
jgi:hypothetical protein